MLLLTQEKTDTFGLFNIRVYGRVFQLGVTKSDLHQIPLPRRTAAWVAGEVSFRVRTKKNPLHPSCAKDAGIFMVAECDTPRASQYV
jgi:hypothetical protein